MSPKKLIETIKNKPSDFFGSLLEEQCKLDIGVLGGRSGVEHYYYHVGL